MLVLLLYYCKCFSVGKLEILFTRTASCERWRWPVWQRQQVPRLRPLSPHRSSQRSLTTATMQMQRRATPLRRLRGALQSRSPRTATATGTGTAIQTQTLIPTPKLKTATACCSDTPCARRYQPFRRARRGQPASRSSNPRRHVPLDSTPQCTTPSRPQ